MKQERFLALDGLRGLAAIAVFLLHFGRAAGPFRMTGGYLAVDLFFLLSGFVLAHAYEARLRAGMSFWAFSKARVIRLYPLYLLGLAIGASVALANIASFDLWDAAPWRERIGSFVSNLAFLPSAANRYSPFPFNGPAWSLFYEMAASLVFGLVAVRLGPRGLVVAILAGFAALVLLALERGGLDSGAQYRTFWLAAARVAFSFAAGVAFYRLWRWRDLKLSFAPFWLPAVLMLAIFAAKPGEWKPLFEVFAAVVAFPLILWLGASARPSRMLAKFCESVGNLSYPLYILHSPLIGAAALLWINMGWGNVRKMEWGPSVGVALIIFVIAYAAAAFYDTPLRRWLNGRGRPSGTPSGIAQPQES